MSDIAISISNLTKQYGSLTALDGVDLQVKQGAFYGLLGPNGAGKTTTINIMASLSNRSGGEVKLFGHDLEKDFRTCRRLVGLVPQEFNFDQFTRCKKMLMFQGGYFGMSRDACETRADELLEQFDLTEKADTQARRLSGGMKRRLIIARAMMHGPKLLILDEPTSGVDVDLRHSLWKFLREINAHGTTILLTTHYIEEAEALCDTIGIINQGKIIAEDATRNMANRLSLEAMIVTCEKPVTEERIQKLRPYATKTGADGHAFTVAFDHNEIPYHDMVEKIMAVGIRITSIQPVDNRLERVFLELTKKERDEHAPNA